MKGRGGFQALKSRLTRYDLPPTIEELNYLLSSSRKDLEDGDKTVFLLIQAVRNYCHAMVVYEQTLASKHKVARERYEKGEENAKGIVENCWNVIDLFLKNNFQVNNKGGIKKDELEKEFASYPFPAINTPLNIAVLYDRRELVVALIDKGANLNEKDFYGATPLYYAIKNQKDKTVNFLLNNHGTEPLNHLSYNYADANIKTKNMEAELEGEKKDQLPVAIALKQNTYAIASMLFAKTDRKLMQEEGILAIIIDRLESTENNSNNSNNKRLVSMRNTLAKAANEIKVGGRRKSRRRRVNRKKRTIRRRR